MCFCFAAPASMTAQVTIGSSETPNPGALLDLREDISSNTVTAKKGLALPRVMLTDLKNLYPMFEADGSEYKLKGQQYSKADQDAIHTGLVVYHIDNCSLYGNGAYVWDGEQWRPLKANATLAGLNFNQDYFDLPSGKDARGMTSQDLEIAWQKDPGPSWTLETVSRLDAIPFTGNPLSPSTLVSSPATMELLPDAMTDTEVTATNPWKSKESRLAFTYAECGNDRYVTLNQTNYALKVNDSFDNSFLYNPGYTGTFPVQGNATWKNTLFSTSSMSSVSPSTGGETLKDGTTASIDVAYVVGNSGIRYDTSDITFSDTQAPKRFDDILVRIMNCNTNMYDPPMEDWARVAGFSEADIAEVKADATGNTSKGPTANGTMLHRDQSGNLFLSGRFGYEDAPLNTVERRWMLNNLAATDYAVGNPHLHGRQLMQGDGVNSVYNTAYYHYPERKLSTYTNNPRLGLLYTWDAATGGKGGKNGNTLIKDAEDVNQNPDRVQGICPNGWHLPSDWEWTELEIEYNVNTSKYSSLPDANGTITIGVGGHERGTTHGWAMIDPCPSPGQTLPPNGQSNIISNDPSIAPGMNILLAGMVYNSASNFYGENVYIWTASATNNSSSAVSRGFYYYMGGTDRRYPARSGQYSVRCKKD